MSAADQKTSAPGSHQGTSPPPGPSSLADDPYSQGIVEVVAEHSTLNADAPPYKSPHSLRPANENGTSPPPFGASTSSVASGTTPPPARVSPPPQGIGTPTVKYKLETREEMQARKGRQNLMNASSSSSNGGALLGPNIGTGMGSSALVGGNPNATGNSPLLGHSLPPSMMGSSLGSPLPATSSPSNGLVNSTLLSLGSDPTSMVTAGGSTTSSNSNNNNGNSHALRFQVPYDYILVLDFEATCEDPEPYGYTPEIIEFPIVVVAVADGRMAAEFHSYVKPQLNPTLSAFCKQLTGIKQSDVDQAPTLEYVIERFQRWYHRTIPRGARAIFATDGPWDMRDFMYHHSVCKLGINFPPLFYTWIDVKSAFAEFFTCRWSKIEAMLGMLGMTFEGRLHSGIDDARNICRIVISLLSKGCTFSTTVQRIPFAPDPVGNNGLLLAAAVANAAALAAATAGGGEEQREEAGDAQGESSRGVTTGTAGGGESTSAVAGGADSSTATPIAEGATWAERVKGTTKKAASAGSSTTTQSLPEHPKQETNASTSGEAQMNILKYAEGEGGALLSSTSSRGNSPPLQYAPPPYDNNNSLTTPPMTGQPPPPPPPPPPPQGQSPPYHHHHSFHQNGTPIVERVSPQEVIAQQIAMMSGSDAFIDLPPPVQRDNRR